MTMVGWWNAAGDVVADLCDVGVPASTPSLSVRRGGDVARVITAGCCRLEPIPEVRRSSAGGDAARIDSMPSPSGMISGSLSGEGVLAGSLSGEGTALEKNMLL
jgi:hypothetical protein